MQRITLPRAVVDDLKETAWQLDMSVPQLMSLIIELATHRDLDTKENMDLQVKQGWKQLRESTFRNPQHLLGKRRRKVREDTPSEDGQWLPTAAGLLTLSLPTPKFRRDRLQELGRERGTSADEEVTRILEEAVRSDYKPRSDEEWMNAQDAMLRELWQNLRDALRHWWSESKRS